MADEGMLIVALSEVEAEAHAEEAETQAPERAAAEAPEPGRVEGVVIAELVNLRDGAPLIRYPELDDVLDEDCCVLASTALALTRDDLGAQLAVVFVGGDPDYPLVLGKLARPMLPAAVERRRRRELVLEADKKITIRCGRSSISLSRDGRLEIRGQHLLSRAASVNRIRGGVIQLN